MEWWTSLALLAAAVPCVAGCSHRTAVARAPASVPLPESSPRASNPPAPSPPSGPPPRAELRPALPGEYVEEGVASWYGIPFHGHRTSDGEIYDMHQFSAAHRTLPFGSVVRVTNLRNGKWTEVRINDRGPFVANRVIDLSLAAAQAIELVGTGTAPVRLELLAGPNSAVGLFGVQVGAFQVEENAERLRDRLAARYSPINVVEYDSPNGVFYRVRVGRLSTEEAARQLAIQLQTQEEVIPFVVRLDQ